MLLQQGFLPNKPTLLLQQDDEVHQGHAIMEVPQEDVGKAVVLQEKFEKAVVLQENRTLQQDHAVLQEKFEKVMDGEDVKAMFPVSHNDKTFHLEDVNDNEED